MPSALDRSSHRHSRIQFAPDAGAGSETPPAAPAGGETMAFQAEVGRLLHIVANALYSESEIFLRELISNASDASDKLRYLSLTLPELLPAGGFAITITADKQARTLTIADRGVGMSRQELIDNLGTIARSGTSAFIEAMVTAATHGEPKSALPQLIGQFGVGFYSAFIVADKVAVLSRKASEATAHLWESDGQGSFTIAPAQAGPAAGGTEIRLHLKDGHDEFLEPWRIKSIVRKYSDHIGLPIRLIAIDKDGKAGEPETVNTASALWTRPRAEVGTEDHASFFAHLGGTGEPWLTLHFQAEGTIEYSGIVYLPTEKPFDLFDPERKSRLKLYVRRVFITEEGAPLLPGWLRFARGVIDTPDLPLNVSRELLQGNATIAKIRTGLVKRMLDALKKKAEEDAEGYRKFWDSFGPVMKEGLYEDFQQREALLALARFRSTAGEALTDLDGYVARMRPGQQQIVYVTGRDAETLRRSPQLEAWLAKGVEVLLLTDPVDEFWLPMVATFKDTPFLSATRGDVDLSGIEAPEGAKAPEAKPEAAGVDGLIALFKLALKDKVKDVRASHRLTDSPVCLVADEGDMDMNLERLLRQHNRLESTSLRVLEVNPAHALILGLATKIKAGAGADGVDDFAHLLLDQARIIEGDPVADPAAFARRLTSLALKGLS